MFSRNFIRFCNKDNDKIIGKMLKRNYWTPDFQEKNFTYSLKPRETNCQMCDEAFFKKLHAMDQRSIAFDKKLDDLIELNKKMDDNADKRIKIFTDELLKIYHITFVNKSG